MNEILDVFYDGIYITDADGVTLNVVFVMTNEVALLSPPLGVNLFVAMGLSGLTLERIAKASFPYMVAIIICTLLVVRFPEIALFLPRRFGLGQ